jgi:hypothetical protein
LFVSGSYIASDPFTEAKSDSAGLPFIRHTLRYDLGTDHAARTGRVVAVDTSFLPYGTELFYNAAPRADLYPVEAPDAIIPSDTSAQVLRYAENSFGAGVAFRKAYGVVALGFPFESVTTSAQRTMLMRAVMRTLFR